LLIFNLTVPRLLRAAEEALKPGSRLYLDIVEAIRESHVDAGAELIKSKEILDQLKSDIETECGKLINFLSAAQVRNKAFYCVELVTRKVLNNYRLQIIDEISPKTKDIIIGAGEKLACLLMTALLRDRGVDAEYINLDSIIPSSYTVKKGLDQEFYDYLPKKLAERIQLCEDRVPVVTGYFGTVPGSLLTSVGRGYTDLCSALLAVGLDAEELQVWKEVDGIFTADPRKVPTARLIPVITPEEAAELTYYGSEVNHRLKCLGKRTKLMKWSRLYTHSPWSK
jgi:aspartate kinase